MQVNTVTNSEEILNEIKNMSSEEMEEYLTRNVTLKTTLIRRKKNSSLETVLEESSCLEEDGEDAKNLICPEEMVNILTLFYLKLLT